MKGLSRRVIVVKSPDGKIFDEAIFIVRDDATERGVTSDELIKEAQNAANQYLREHAIFRRLGRLPPPVFACAGAGITALIWALTVLL